MNLIEICDPLLLPKPGNLFAEGRGAQRAQDKMMPSTKDMPSILMGGLIIVQDLSGCALGGRGVLLGSCWGC